MTRSSGALAVLLTAVLAGCGGDGLSSPGGGGVVKFDLATSHDDTGALVVAVSGGAVDSMSVDGGYHVYTSQLEGGGMSAVITGPINGGPLLTVHIPDPRRTAAYTAVAVQAAARSTYALLEPADYHLIRR